MTLPERLAHLPDNKRRELERVARILFDEFEDAQKNKLSDKHKNGRILKLILFGSYARGMISAPLRKIKDEDAAQARTLRAKRREVVTLLRSIRPDDPDAAMAIAATWGPRIKDDTRFWREL